VPVIKRSVTIIECCRCDFSEVWRINGEEQDISNGWRKEHTYRDNSEWLCPKCIEKLKKIMEEFWNGKDLDD